MLYHLVSLPYILGLTNTTSKKVASFGESSLAFKVMFNCFEFKLNYPDINIKYTVFEGKILMISATTRFILVFFHLLPSFSATLFTSEPQPLTPYGQKGGRTGRFFKGGFGVFRDRVNHLEVLMGTKAGQTVKPNNLKPTRHDRRAPNWWSETTNLKHHLCMGDMF